MPSIPDALPRSSRYELLVKIASGGMATVYVGRIRGAEGFSRLVAIKRAHPHLLEDPEFRSVVVAEARLASLIHHPNVVSVLDVEERDGELLLVMDFIEGAALSMLLGAARTSGDPLPPRIAVRTSLEAALGLHAAHELADDAGHPLGLVHRDVSPQNILVGQDGASRISDFGIAKCVTGTHSGGTQMGVLKGKLPYMAPEYIEFSEVDPRGDVFALGVVLWESLTNQRLFRADNDLETMRRVASMAAPPVSAVAPWVGEGLDAVVARALEKGPDRRFASARAFAEALESAGRRADLVAGASEVGDYVRVIAGADIAKRRELVRARSGPIIPAARVSSSTALVDPERTATDTSHAPAVPAPSEPANDADTIEDDTSAVHELASGASAPHGEPPPAAAMTAPPAALERTTAPLLEPPPPPAESAREPSLSTIDRSGVSSAIASHDATPTAPPITARKERARVGVLVVVSSLALATISVAASRFAASSSAHGHSTASAPASADAPPAAESVAEPAVTAAAPSAAVAPASPPTRADAPPEPPTAEASASASASPVTSAKPARAVYVPQRGHGSTPTRSEPAKGDAKPAADKAPPNPYGKP
jgi:serine/threonine-protein kinase